jgi:hypothetical protein
MLGLNEDTGWIEYGVCEGQIDVNISSSKAHSSVTEEICDSILEQMALQLAAVETGTSASSAQDTHESSPLIYCNITYLLTPWP